MTKSNLGRLEKVDMRGVWNSEARDFTPWLAQEDNLALLGEVLEIDLELESQEKSVGPFRADILCKDTATGHWVLIENQIERTDHTHLGQLLTYAAGLKAVTIVWIAAQFTDEHRAALDWLNEVTNEDVNFFGLEIELWKIGDSPAAPKFNVVSKPNEWVRTVSLPPAATETNQLQLEYWTQFHDFIKLRNSPVRPQKPLPQHWMNFALGKSHVFMEAVINTRDKRLRAGIVIGGSNAKRYFSTLYNEREQYETPLGQELDWVEAPDKKHSYIYIHRLASDPADRSRWIEYFTWMAEQLEALNKVFRPVVKDLDLPQG
jgi:hypothetical protein